MTDQRTLKKIIEEQRQTIGELTQKLADTEKLLKEVNENCKYKKKVEAANKIVSAAFLPEWPVNPLGTYTLLLSGVQLTQLRDCLSDSQKEKK